MFNVEKSGFRRGEYVGYGAGRVWRITRIVGGWQAGATDHNPRQLGYLNARTLQEVSRFLSDLSPD